jgi:multidrug resistance efflux pump
MYRNDAEAAQLRIQTLEAELAERDAALAARDAEIAELQREIDRAPANGWPRVWPVLLSLATGAIGLAAGLASKR